MLSSDTPYPSAQEMWAMYYGYTVMADEHGFTWDTWGMAFSYDSNSLIRNMGKTYKIVNNEIRCI